VKPISIARPAFDMDLGFSKMPMSSDETQPPWQG